MSLKTKLCGLLVLLAVSCAHNESLHSEEPTSSYLIEAADLHSKINRSSIKVLDFRKEAKYEEAHIPGAVNIWRSDIEDSSYAYGGMMAPASQIETLFSEFGIKSTDTLVIYDDNGLCNAARLWWILQNYDFANVRLLHGGLSAWRENGGSVSKEIPTPKVELFSLGQSHSMRFHLSREEMKDAVYEGGLILDTRTEDEFSGKRRKRGAAKGGRIPGSVHIDWAETIHYDSDMKIKSIDQLEAIYAPLVESKSQPIIVYCHSGVRSAHTTFILTQLLGCTDVKNYDGSWTEWSHFDQLPTERDSLTQIEI